MSKLEDFMMAMNYVNDSSDASVYLDLEEDNLIYMSDYFEEVDLDEIEENPDRYIFFVSSYDVFDLDIYNEFIERLDGSIYNQFVRAFDGRGKYGRFKSLLSKYKLWDDFNRFEERKLQDYIEQWSIENEITIDGLVMGRIREATIDDYKVLFQLMKEVYDFHQLNRPDYFRGKFQFPIENLQFILNDPNYDVVVYEEDEVLGYITYEYIEKHHTKKCHIHEIGVKRKTQGKGIGNKLYHYVEEKAKENHVEIMELSVFSFNEKAIAFYEAEGMEASKIIYEKKIGD